MENKVTGLIIEVFGYVIMVLAIIAGFTYFLAEHFKWKETLALLHPFDGYFGIIITFGVVIGLSGRQIKKGKPILFNK